MTKEKIEFFEIVLDRKLETWEIEILDRWERLSKLSTDEIMMRFARGQSKMRRTNLLIVDSLYQQYLERLKK